MEPPTSIVIPTRDRPSYLEVTLASLAPEAAAAGAEVLVVEDGPASAVTQAAAARHGARHAALGSHLGLNAARNRGVSDTRGALVVFLDDDVRVRPGWLAALLAAAAANPQADVFAGRILASLEGDAPRSCGREQPPVTTLDLGEEDRPTRFAWGSNMAIRRAALEATGPFDETLGDGGDEQEWQERHAGSAEPRARYVAAAIVEHRREGVDARLRSLCRASYARGRGARRFDDRRGAASGTAAELRTLAGCLGHVVRRRCPAGLTMAAHSAGRLREALADRAHRRLPVGGPNETGAGRSGPPPANGGAPVDDFLSGSSGTVGGLDAVRRRGLDALAQTGELLGARNARLALAARHSPPLRRVLVLGVTRPEHAASAAAIRAELLRSRHEVSMHTTAAGTAGKFENLNALLAEHPAAGHDWLLVVDDDIELPRGFLDRFLFLCDRFDLTLAQPAHRLHSHAAWEVTRRRPGSVLRETNFVEIGPVTAFARRSFEVLLPFPPLRMGWGLDMHWAAVARREGWRCGIVDAVAIHHRLAPAAAGYGREAAVAEAREFLAERPHITAAEAQLTLTTHAGWRAT
ncbi:MAG TPA: glycosyltransferase [Solirubrobacteraceae bacterium]|nr:glycosyltransferase [Solirubrobacteraceae bacterium]